jgi:hypothetical protein
VYRIYRELELNLRIKPRKRIVREKPEPLALAVPEAIRLDHIQPGNPQQNAYIERYNRTVRYDWLSHYLFESIEEVQNYATDWMWTYNHERPNMALGGITPKQKSALLTNSTSDRC